MLWDGKIFCKVNDFDPSWSLSIFLTRFEEEHLESISKAEQLHDKNEYKSAEFA